MQREPESSRSKTFRKAAGCILLFLAPSSLFLFLALYLFFAFRDWRVPYVADPKLVLVIPTTGKWAGKAIYVIGSAYPNIKQPKPHKPLLKMPFRTNWSNDAETQDPTFRLASIAEIRQLPLPYIASSDGGGGSELLHISIKVRGDDVEIRQTTLSQDTACVYNLTPAGPRFLSAKVFDAVKYY